MSEAKHAPWVWRRFGGRLMLVSLHGGSKVILAAHDGVLETRCDLGRLVPLTEESDLAALFAAAPETAAERDKLREQVAALAKMLEWAVGELEAYGGADENDWAPPEMQESHRLIAAAKATTGGAS